jgi:hypothetical protein
MGVTPPLRFSLRRHRSGVRHETCSASGSVRRQTQLYPPRFEVFANSSFSVVVERGYVASL